MVSIPQFHFYNGTGKVDDEVRDNGDYLAQNYSSSPMNRVLTKNTKEGALDWTDRYIYSCLSS